ncbi:hypothetical protein UFOVP23_3 [uncultured Caudovirales phage]|uniref:Uncharacterized protein n=1 Tax=uncultured Caudovirales phage TaxID=2100421 RepID=A0A6J5TB66_9CAUD|nr:hypothetical protein UFOVP23_3 [uncultured Caudovirales phage]
MERFGSAPSSRFGQPAPRPDLEKTCYQKRTTIEPRYSSQSFMPFKRPEEGASRGMAKDEGQMGYSMINDQAPNSEEKGIASEQARMGSYEKAR